MIEPKLLILDEPEEGIQPDIVAQIGEVFRRLIEEDGLTVLLEADVCEEVCGLVCDYGLGEAGC